LWLSRLELSSQFTGQLYYHKQPVLIDFGFIIRFKIDLDGLHLDGYVWASNLFDCQYRIFEKVNRGITEDGEPLTIGAFLVYRF
jgi:hypothetical protein